MLASVSVSTSTLPILAPSRLLLPLLSILLSLLAPSPAGAISAYEWKNPTPQGNALWGVDFESATVGYAVGDRGTVLRTLDGGASWTDLTDRDALDVPFRGLQVVAPGVLVSVTADGEILRTSDGGESWISIAHPGTQDLHELAYEDGVLTALEVTQNVLRSTDGGLTWGLVTSPGLFGLKGQHWFDAMHGIVFGSGVAVETADGGASWQPLPGVSDDTIDSHDDMDFFGAEGVLVGEFSTWRTHDGGKSWEDITVFEHPIYQRRVFMFGPTSWVVFTDTEGANILYTTDDGVTFDAPVFRDDVVGFLDAVRHPAGGYFTVSSSGDLYTGTTDATSWTNATQAPDDGDRITIADLERLPGGTIFAAGRSAFQSGPRWLRSDDDGETWLVHPTPPNATSFFDVSFFDDELGLAGGSISGQQLHVFRTTDGGDSWSMHPMASMFGFITAVDFMTEDVVVATVVRESNSIVERSVDGGVSWSALPVGHERMECLSVVDANVAYAGGGSFFNSHVVRTEDGGATWSAPAGVGLDGGTVKAMHFLDPLTGVLSTGDIYRTVDGGETWSVVAAASNVTTLGGHPGLLVSSGYIVGDVRFSTDAGLTWSPASWPTVYGPDAVLVMGDRVLMGGAGSTILSGVVEEVVAVPGGAGAGGPSQLDRPGALRVSARPLGAGAEIRVEVDGGSEGRFDGQVDVAVFDVRGRRVRHLHTGGLAGSGSGGLGSGGPGVGGPGAGHELRFTWDGTDGSGRPVSSGVVWVLARAGGESASARIVLTR